MSTLRRQSDDDLFEYLQRSKLTEHGNLYRWKSQQDRTWCHQHSNGVVVEKYAVLSLRHEIAPPAEQHTDEVQGSSFRVVQEFENAGDEESKYLDLVFKFDV